MQLQPFKYLGRDQRQWDFDSFRVTLTDYPAEQQQPRHRHENPTYFFLLQGAFVDESDDLGVRTPDQFELLFHPSGSWHESRASESGRTGINLEPSDRWLTKYGLESQDLGSYRIDRDPVKATDLLKLLLHNFEGKTIEDQLLEVILPPTNTSSLGPKWLNELNEALDSHDANHWNLSSLASALAVHPVYLARVFRSRYGSTVTTYLLRKRLLKCAAALMEGHSGIEVALTFGFADHSHFIRTFRAFFGMPPRTFLSQISCKSSMG